MSLPNITLATSVRYGNYKQHLDSALFFIDVLKDSFNDIKQFIKLPRNLNIVFRPVRDAYGRAFYVKPNVFSESRQYVVEVDVRQDLATFKNTMIHELVHIEQFYQGRLKDAGSMHFKWNGKKMLIDTSSLDIYNGLPWEVEANVRAELLSHVVFN
jgi:hypothetical protein